MKLRVQTRLVLRVSLLFTPKQSPDRSGLCLDVSAEGVSSAGQYVQASHTLLLDETCQASESGGFYKTERTGFRRKTIGEK